MSASASPDKCEPNLTPMLDMVLQLVMFFMLCANFLMEELNKSVKLPNAVSARPLGKGDKRLLFINMTVDDPATNTKRSLSINQGPVKEVFDPAQRAQLLKFLLNQFSVDKSRTPAHEWEAGKGRTIIALRADNRLTFKEINDVLTICRESGYTDISLRAIQKGTEK